MESDAGEVFVGRVPELDELSRALAAARAGRGRTVLLMGEAGIGKSRLASELATRAHVAGFEVLIGRSIDLVGTELPYQPFVDALRRIGDGGLVDDPAAGSQLRLFEQTLATLIGRSTRAPVMLELEDVHWADVSTLDLIVFLAHNIGDRSIVLVATFRADDPPSAARMRRLTDAVRRSGSALIVELSPLERDELDELIMARLGGPAATELTSSIAARSEGNPFFAEELASAAVQGRSDELPRHLRDVLLLRVAPLDRGTQQLLRLAAVAGRDVAVPLLHAAAGVPARQVQASLRSAVEAGVLVAEATTGTFRFRHALLAEAVYGTVLPGEREQLHERLAEALSCGGAGDPAELAPHWAAAGRAEEALVASMEAARRAQAAFGVPEALAHLERSLALWPAVPGAADLLQLDFAALCAWAAELASRAGTAPRAVELARRAIQLVEATEPLRAARLYESLGRYLHESGRTEAALDAFERAVELVPGEEASAPRAAALEALALGLMLAWRFDESLPICEQALTLAREVGDGSVEMRALFELGRNLAYLGRGDEGLGCLERALELARDSDDPLALLQGYISLTDVLTMLGRPRQAASFGEQGVDAVRRYGVDSTVLVANHIEALLAIGEWDEASRLSAAALRAVTANFPYMLFMLQAEVEVGRGEFDRARAHLDTASASLREDRGLGVYDVYLAELALWERRWTDAHEAVQNGLTRARPRQAAQLRVWFCAKGLRAHAELLALARARRDTDAVRTWLARARRLTAVARGAAAEAAPVTPNAGGWLALAEAEYQRARGLSQPASWALAASTWDQLERPPLAAYCRWREAEALVAAGAPRTEAAAPLRRAHTVAARIGAAPLRRELELLAQRARLDLVSADERPTDQADPLEHVLGLTPREAEVLELVARGYTNREIAATLFISVKTASVHVSHILSKLGATKRTDAATIAHRLAPPPGSVSQPHPDDTE